MVHLLTDVNPYPTHVLELYDISTLLSDQEISQQFLKADAHSSHHQQHIRLLRIDDTTALVALGSPEEGFLPPFFFF